MGLTIIRTHQPPAEHLDQLIELVRAEGLRLDPADLTRRLHQLPKEDRLLFAVEEDRVIGYAHLRIARELLADDTAELAALLVGRGFRRRGVGTLLVHAAEAWAAESDRARLLLRAPVGQREMHAFCVALGYQEEGTSLAFARDLRRGRRAEAPTQQL